MFGTTYIARKNLDITLSLTPMHEVDVILEINIFFNEPLHDSRPNISYKFETRKYVDSRNIAFVSAEFEAIKYCDIFRQVTRQPFVLVQFTCMNVFLIYARKCQRALINFRRDTPTIIAGN